MKNYKSIILMTFLSALFLGYILTDIVPKFLKPKEKLLSILEYHGVRDDYWGSADLFVKVSDFEKQMKYLKDNDYTPIFLSEIDSAYKYENPIVITFDDGYNDVFENAFPIMKKYNIKSNFFIIAGFIGGNAYVDEKMVKKMSDSGLVEIGSHTLSHLDLAKEDSVGLKKQLLDSKEKLEKISGKKVTTMAYPYGSYNDIVIDSVKDYYDYACVTTQGQIDINNITKYKLKRVYIPRDMTIEKFINLI